MNFCVGIDPSLVSTGVSVCWENGKRELSRHGSQPTDGTVAARMRRYHELTASIIRAIPTTQPTLIAIEGYAMRAKGRVCDLAEFGGILRYRLKYEAFKNQPRILDVSPSTLKQFATGKGNADKKEMQEAVLRRFNIVCSTDEADAFLLSRLALVYCDLVRPEGAHQKKIIEDLRLKGAAG